MSINYTELVRQHLDEASTPISPSNLHRAAVEAGATGNGPTIVKAIRFACETVAKGSDYKRIRVKGIKGYQYAKAI